MRNQALANAVLAIYEAASLAECLEATAKSASVLTGSETAVVDLGVYGNIRHGVPSTAPSLVVAVADAKGAVLGSLEVSGKVDAYSKDDERTLAELARVVAKVSARLREIRDLREADRRKDEFLAVLSHELRSPLNVVTGHLDLLRFETPGAPGFDESLAAIERNTLVQAQIVADLLDVTRIITGRLKLDLRPFDTAAVLKTALDGVRLEAERNGLTLQVAFAPDLPALVGDATRVKQVVWNLLSNAVKHTEPGGTVRVEASAKGAAVEIVVSDDGAGIAPHFLPLVFDRFQQEDPERGAAHGGLGLGLSIVRHLVEAHGGTVEVASDGPGRGACFTVLLPAELRATADAPSEAQRVRRAQLLQELRVLAVDDQRDARELVRAVLARLGAAVTTVATAEEALSHLADGEFDLIVCDIRMPVMDGLALMRQWRQEESECGLSPTPALALTAHATAQDAEEAAAAGFHGHLPKPVRLGDLVAAVCRLTGRREG